ncbi:MAG: M28 family peptidase [Opitutaceae bacterium]
MLKKFLKYIRNVTLGVGIVLAGVWVYLAQPTLRTSDLSDASPNVDRLRETVKTLSVDFHPRTFKNVENTEKTASFIQKHFEAAGGRIKNQSFAVTDKEFRNVCAFFGPETGPRFIIGAHYDSHGITPGADDNASGIAGLVELAYLLQKHPPKMRVELAAYPLEEPPFFATQKMGSYFHAKAVSESNDEILGVIVLEMIGYFDETYGSQEYPALLFNLIYPNTGDFIALIGKLDQRSYISKLNRKMKGASKVAVYSIAAPTKVPGVDFSDHRNYWKFGYDAAMVTDTAFYRNQAYHTANDTWDRLDYEKMAEVVKAVFNVIKSPDE